MRGTPGPCKRLPLREQYTISQQPMFPQQEQKKRSAVNDTGCSWIPGAGARGLWEEGKQPSRRGDAPLAGAPRTHNAAGARPPRRSLLQRELTTWSPWILDLLCLIFFCLTTARKDRPGWRPDLTPRRIERAEFVTTRGSESDRLTGHLRRAVE